jgi:hypothetical protein
MSVGGPNQRLMERNGRVISRVYPLFGFYGRFLRGKL